MRKLWLTFTAMLFCSIASFAQTEIEVTQENFVSVLKNNSGSTLVLTENIDLGILSDQSEAIIPTFSGTLNGNGKTITYQAGFTGATQSGSYSLFGEVSGTIKNLNVNATVTLGGSANMMNVALICGYLTSSGIIEFCNVSGNVNSTIDTKNGGSDAGLIAGESAGTIRYCIGVGNVVGVGYAGGLIGQMTEPAKVLACSFTGSVTANKPDGGWGDVLLGAASGNFAGGICGHASNDSDIDIDFCVANATVNRSDTGDGNANAILCSASYWSVTGGGADATYCYGTGTVDGSVIDANNDLADNSGIDGNTLYFKGENNMTADQIAGALNDANSDENFYFVAIDGEVVLVIAGGQQQIVCEAPIGLSVTIGEESVNVSWSVANQNSSFVETNFIVTIQGEGVELEIPVNNATSLTIPEVLPPSTEPYVFSVRSVCQDENSESETYSLYVNENCPTINALQASNVYSTSADITWDGEAEEVKLNGVAVVFNGQTLALEDLTPATTYIVEAIVYCTVDGENVARPTSVTFTTHGVGYETKQSGRFNDPNTWADNEVPQGAVATITINKGHIVTVDHNLTITNDYKIAVNKGVLHITQQGQLINTTNANVPGIIEIISPYNSKGLWTFIGAPFEDEYALATIIPELHDVTVSRYDYDDADWSSDWAHAYTLMYAGEGYFAWPFYSGPITFTTYGDLYDYSTGSRLNYDFDRGCHTAVNNTDVTIEAENLGGNTSTGRWMALSNPYPAKLSVSKFVAGNNIVSTNQGKGIYRLTDKTQTVGGEEVQKYDFITSGDIAMTEGFFVNLASGNSVTFTKEQLTNYPTTQSKSQVAPREFINLALVDEGVEVDLLFAYNEESDLAYDIFDANKMFSPVEISEPYFVTDGISLVKEEVNELPYYATMNVRSYKDTVMNFVMKNIPEGLAVSLIDGEQVIDMVEGSVYSTNVATGENADRFKLLVKKNLGIADVEELEVNITNNNRHISIETTETDLQVEVYNALGQKVLSTKDRNFTLNQVSAGAYLIKAFNNKASKTQKIVVE